MANLEQLDSSKAFDNTTHWVFLKKNYIQLKRINGCRIYFDREHIVVNLGCYLSCLFVVKIRSSRKRGGIVVKGGMGDLYFIFSPLKVPLY